MSAVPPPRSPSYSSDSPVSGTPPPTAFSRDASHPRLAAHPTPPSSRATIVDASSLESPLSRTSNARGSSVAHSKDSSATSSVARDMGRLKLSLDPSRSAFTPSFQRSPTTPLEPGPLYPARGSSRPVLDDGAGGERAVFTPSPHPPSPAGELELRRLEIMAQLSGPPAGGHRQSRPYSPNPVGGARDSSQPHPNVDRSSPAVFSDSEPSQVAHPTATNARLSDPTSPLTGARNGRSGTSASIYAPRSPQPAVQQSAMPTPTSNGTSADKIRVVVSPKRDAWEIAAEQSRMRSGQPTSEYLPSPTNVGLGIDMGFGMGVMPDSSVRPHFGGPRSRAASGGGRAGLGGRDGGGAVTPQMLLEEQLANIANGRSSDGQYDARSLGGYAASPSPGLPPLWGGQQQQQQPFGSAYARTGSSNSIRRNTSPFPAASLVDSSGGFQDPYTAALLSVIQAQQLQGQGPSLSSYGGPLASLVDQRARQLADQELLTRFEAIQYLHPDLFGRHPDGRGRSVGDGDGARLAGFGVDSGSFAAAYDGSINGGGSSRARELGFSPTSFGGSASNVADQELLEYLIKHNLPLDGPSPNNKKRELYKTELCGPYMSNLDKETEQERCQYLSKCQYAHGHHELRPAKRHPKYKTQICTTFWLFGGCAYGRRCCFLHDDIPPGGIPELGDLGTQESLQRILAARQVRPTGVTPAQSSSQNLSHILSQQNYFQSSGSDVAPSLESLSPLGHNHPLPQYRSPPQAPVQQSVAQFPRSNGGGFPLDGLGRTAAYMAPDEREQGPNGIVLRARDRSDSLSVNMNPIPELTSIPPSLPRSISYEQSAPHSTHHERQGTTHSYRSSPSPSPHHPRSASDESDRSYLTNAQLGYQSDSPFGASNGHFVHPSRVNNLSEDNRGSASLALPSVGHSARSASYTDGTLDSRWAPRPIDQPALGNGRPSVSTLRDEIVRVPGRTDRARSATWGVGSAAAAWGQNSSSNVEREDVGAIGERIGLPSAGRKGIW